MSDSEEFSADSEGKQNLLKDMDELDAALFGKKKITPKKESTKPSSILQEKGKYSKKNVGFKQPDSSSDSFDFDDPLADILSDDDESFSKKKPPSLLTQKKPQNIGDVNRFQKTPLNKRSTTSSASSSAKKAGKNDDVFFDDDDENDDVLQNLGLTEEKSKTKQQEKPSNEYMSPLDKLLAASSTPSQLPQKPAPARKFRFDKDGNLIKEKLEPEREESFGSYLPSSASPAQRSSRNLQSVATKKEDSFLDFLNSDLSSSKSKKAVDSSIADKAAGKRSELDNSRGFDSDLEAGSNKAEDVKKLSTPVKQTDDDFLDFLTKGSKTPTKKADAPSTPGSGRNVGRRPIRGDFLDLGDEIDIDLAPTEDKKRLLSASSTQPGTPLSKVSDVKPSTAQLQSEQEKPALSVDEPFHKTSDILTERPPLPRQDVRPATTGGLQQKLTPITLDSNNEFFQNMKVSFQSDLDVTKQAYEERMKMLHVEVAEIKARAEREVDAIKESYNLRMEIMRKQMKDQFEDTYDKDSSEQDEIKRLRALHTKSLEDTRLDYEDRINIMKECHKKEMKAIETSTDYVRNIDSMMRKVDDATTNIANLSAKYESLSQHINLKWSDMVSDNQRFTTGFQTKLDEIHQTNANQLNNIQQIVSRLEGYMTEMNRALRESQYQMQLERNRLEGLQTVIENEKRHILQQVTAERADIMNAHKEAVELRNKYDRSMREDSDRLRQWQEYLLQSQRVLEEARSAEVKQTSARETEWRKMEAIMAKERADVSEKSERLSSLEAKLAVQREDLERREMAVTLSEKRVQDRTDELRRQEEDVRYAAEKSSKKLEASVNVLEEAKRIEQENEIRLNEINENVSVLEKQRNVIIQERKQLVENRHYPTRDGMLDNRLSAAHSPPQKHRVGFVKVMHSTPEANTDAKKSHWLYTAQKDRDFLDDEEIFLEALKCSPYHAPEDDLNN